MISMTLFTTLGCEQIVDYFRGFHAYTLQSSSMEKTIYKDETFLCDGNAYKFAAPMRGDVVAFGHKDLILVKRLIGLPGDKIEGKDGVVSRNGVFLDEPYAEHIGPSFHDLDRFGPVTVAADQIFVLGDNRDNSLDSRLDGFGQVKLSDIQGKAISILKSEHGRKGQKIQ